MKFVAYKTGKMMVAVVSSALAFVWPMRKLWQPSTVVASGVMLAAAVSPHYAYGREVEYKGDEEMVYVTPGEPTQISFPGAVEGGYKKRNSSLSLDKQGNYLVIFANPSLTGEGEAIIVQLEDQRTYSMRIASSSDEHSRDNIIKVIDNRPPEAPSDGEEEVAKTNSPQPMGFAPSSTIAGLMREIVLVAEFGKSKAPAGYRRDNTYSGETVLNDGAVNVQIDEMFLGSNYWGYVLSVENLLDTTQRLNPATFRMDGTRAISMSNWELAPRPMTAEQKMADAHKGKIYVITRSKRR